MVDIKLGEPHEADHLHKFQEINKTGDLEIMTIICKQRDCYAEGGLDRAVYNPGKIGPKRFWMKKDPT